MIDAFAPPSSSAAGDSNREGDSGAASRADHRHSREAADANLTSTAGNISQIDVADTANAGALTTGARSDHQHALPAPAAPTTSAVNDSAATGSATTIARADHKHGREAFATTSDIADIAATEAAGTATTIPRGDHVHALPSMLAWTTYTPALTNVTTGTATGRYMTFGQTLYMAGDITAGTATANGTITVGLPASLSSGTTVVQVGNGSNGANVARCVIGTNLTAVTISKDSAGANFTAGDSLAAIRWSLVIEVQ